MGRLVFLLKWFTSSKWFTPYMVRHDILASLSHPIITLMHNSEYTRKYVLYNAPMKSSRSRPVHFFFFFKFSLLDCYILSTYPNTGAFCLDLARLGVIIESICSAVVLDFTLSRFDHVTRGNWSNARHFNREITKNSSTGKLPIVSTPTLALFATQRRY